MKNKVYVFVIIFFLAFINLSFSETTYFDQNGNLISKEEYENISKNREKGISNKNSEAASKNRFNNLPTKQDPPVQVSTKQTFRDNVSRDFKTTNHKSTGFSNLTGETTPMGYEIHRGPRGGLYHYSKTGNKVYEKKKK